jgi:hypothetical protein
MSEQPESREYTLKSLAQGILQLADDASMPDSYWRHDSRIEMARNILGVPEGGRESHAYLWQETEVPA